MLLHGALLIVVGTILFNIGSCSVPAVAMMILAQSEMAFAPFWIFLFLGESPSGWSLLGGAIILTAVIGKAVLDSRPQSTARHDEVLEPTPVSRPAPASTPRPSALPVAGVLRRRSLVAVAVVAGHPRSSVPARHPR